MNPFDLTGHVALITGGNGGIGLGYARGLARAGADLVIWGRDAEKNAAARDELERLGADVLAVTCDVTDEREVDRSFDAAVEWFGRVDSVFANAGAPTRATPFVATSLEEWREIMDVNVDGAFLTLRAGVRHMVDRGGGGSLVVTSSIAARFGMPRGEHYAASKAGLAAIARSLAVEFGKHGVRANAIVPGWIQTEMTSTYLESERFQAAVLPRIPRRRWGRPEDFEAIAVYLASPASEWHTGDVIVIDGGYSVF